MRFENGSKLRAVSPSLKSRFHPLLQLIPPRIASHGRMRPIVAFGAESVASAFKSFDPKLMGFQGLRVYGLGVQRLCCLRLWALRVMGLEG